MKIKDISLIIILLFAAIILSISNRKETSQKEIKNQKPSEWFFAQRAFPSGVLNKEAYRQAQKQSLEMRNSSRDGELYWQEAGPNNIGGRLTDIEFKPGDPSTVYLGAASGGVFKSTDDGLTFLPIFDEALSLSIGDIAISAADAEVVYVGTGEANPGGGSMAYDGDGIYKSDNGGNSWQHIGLENIGSVGRIAVHPNESDIVYVAAMGYLFENNSERGVYKSIDGGETWNQSLYLNDSTGAIDIAIHPQNPDTIYAAMWQRVRRLEHYTYGGSSCGIYRSYNGGESWEELQTGLPSGTNVGRIGIDISRSNPNVLYAIYADRTGYFEGIYKSEDGGDSWTQTNDNNLSDMYASYGWWFGRLKIDPQDPQVVYAIGFDMYKTTNGGNSWFYISSGVHVDHHEIAISPNNSNQVLLGNDGGLYLSSNAGQSWTHHTNLPITQFYTCAIDESLPERIYGGAQDNGTNRTLSGNPDAWAPIYWGDGFYCLIDPNDNRYVYAEYQYGNFARSTNYGSSFSPATSGINGGDRKNWNTPVVMNPQNSSSLYYGANRLYKSINKAQSWQVISSDLTNGPSSGNQTFGTITTISVSPVDTNFIYVGTDDANVWMTTDNGATWLLISNDLPQRWISRVVADPVDVLTAYVCLSGFRENEYMPHVLKTEDAGLSWEDISQGLPEAPVNDLIVDPDETNRLIVATDVGVFYKDSETETWQLLAEGMPMVPVTDLSFHRESNKLLAATYGRSMYYTEMTVGTDEMTDVGHEYFDFSIAPNPVTNFFRINELSIRGGEQLEIFSLDGKCIYQKRLQNLENRMEIDKSIFKPGTYLLSIKQNNEQKTKKFIVR